MTTNSAGCGCPNTDAHACILIRYGCDCGDPSERCECPCHQPEEDEGDDFLAGKTACDLAGDGTCEACQ